MSVGLGLGLVSVHLFRFSILCVFQFSLDYLVCSCVFCFSCVRFSLFSTVPKGWLGRRLQNDLWYFCVQWQVKP